MIKSYDRNKIILMSDDLIKLKTSKFCGFLVDKTCAAVLIIFLINMTSSEEDNYEDDNDEPWEE